MITTIPDRERDLQAQVDALTEELERLRAQEPVAWVDVKDRHEGPYEFHGMALLDSGKHHLYAAPPAQPADPTIDEQVASVNAVFDAWRNGEDATLTLGLAAQPAHPDEFACPLCFDDPANIKPAEPVQRLSDERAAFEAWHNEYRTQELVRRDDTYYNTHARCRWEGWQARAIESALQPGWRPEWPAFVEYWTHESHLQTFADRERFRAAAKAMLEAAPKATK
jgi:hypothetical protein